LQHSFVGGELNELWGIRKCLMGVLQTWRDLEGCDPNLRFRMILNG
jgi:hypothetical protein